MPRRKELGLIPEAIPEVETEFEEQDSLDIQFHLPLDEQKKLISVPANALISNEMYVTAVALARSARVPLWGINIIPTKNGPKPYINADGVKFRIANDKRGILSDDFEIIQIPHQMGDTAIVKRTLILKNGQSFNGLGAVKVDSQWNEGNALLKADTKAGRRAGYSAIANAVGMPMWDEDADKSTNGSTIEGTYRVVPSSAPATVSQFLVWQQGQKLTDAEILTVTGIDIGEELNQRDIPEMYKKLVEYQQGKVPDAE